MKRLFFGIVCTMLFCTAVNALTPAFWGESDTLAGIASEPEKYVVTLPEFDVTINGINIPADDHNRHIYPFAVYNGITYFPLTHSNMQLLGLGSVWTPENGLVIYRRHISEVGRYVSDTFPNSQMEESKQRQPYELEFSSTDVAISALGEKLTEKAEGYPILAFSDVTYIPLTYRLATELLGCYKYEFSAENGLELCAESNFESIEYYIDHSYHDRVVTKAKEGRWLYCNELVIRIVCGDQRLLGPFSQNMTIFFNDGTKKQFGGINDCFGYSDAPEDANRWVGGNKLDYSDGWIYTTYGSYWGGVSPVYCKVNVETGEIVILGEQ